MNQNGLVLFLRALHGQGETFQAAYSSLVERLKELSNRISAKDLVKILKLIPKIETVGQVIEGIKGNKLVEILEIVKSGDEEGGKLLSEIVGKLSDKNDVDGLIKLLNNVDSKDDVSKFILERLEEKLKQKSANELVEFLDNTKEGSLVRKVVLEALKDVLKQGDNLKELIDVLDTIKNKEFFKDVELAVKEELKGKSTNELVGLLTNTTNKTKTLLKCSVHQKNQFHILNWNLSKDIS